VEVATALRSSVVASSRSLDSVVDTAPASVTIDRITATFGGTTALDDVSLDVRTGEILCLLGPSGSGKSTLLRIVAGISRPDRGRIVIDGVEVEGSGGSIGPERRRVGMVFQDYALFPHLTVAANVAFGLRGRSRAEADRTVGALLGRVGLSQHADRYPHTLSGGERQRVALARALAPAPRVLLLDEPFSSLDDRLRDRVRRETLGLLRQTGTTAMIVTHDPAEAASVGDRIALLQRGRLLQCGSAEDLYARPTTAFAARFFSDVNEVRGTCRRGRVETPLGSFAAPHLAEHAAARVCIRPEHVRVAAGPTGIRARVLASEFQGEIDRVTLDVAGLTAPLSLRAFGRARLVPGNAVYLEFESSHAVVVADDEG
jgi:iron(III) transport system ATP-binding protein